jgi:hypothetical protein
MSTSGQTTYQLTGLDLINAAYRKTGVMGKGQTADTEELVYGLEAFNLVLTQLRGRGMQLWKLIKSTLPIAVDTATYSLSQPNKPNKIQQMWISPNNSGTNIPIELTSIFNYNILPTSTSGVPVKASYIPGNSTGTISIWPKPSASVVSSYTLYYVGVEEIQILTNATQTVDLPNEWQMALIWGIAAELAIELNVPLADRSEIRKIYENAVLLAEEGGQENASLYVQPRQDY